MSNRKLAIEIAACKHRRLHHPNTTPIERLANVTVVKVPDYRPLWGFGWARCDAPRIALEGLNLPELLEAFRDAWRRCNGENWSWVMTYDGRPVANDTDELLEQLDAVNLGDLPFATLALRAA